MKHHAEGIGGAQLRPPSVQGASAGVILTPCAPNFSIPTNLDDLDRVLINHLLQDGRMTNRDLATHTGISESAVSIRLRKLAANGTVVFSAVIDWEAAGFEWLVIARIKTQARSPREVAVDVTRLDQSEHVSITLGRHDVLAHFLVKDRDELRQLTDVDLPAINGIADMSVDLATHTTVPTNGRRGFLARSAPALRLPAPVIDLDDLDLAILQELIDDGRQSSRKIARTHDVSEGTVRARMSRLTQAGLVRVVAMVDPVALGSAGVIASVTTRVDRTRIDIIHKELSAMPEMFFVAICVGSADISFLVTAQDPQHLVEFGARRVQIIEGVISTDTLYLVDLVLVSPYMKRLDTED